MSINTLKKITALAAAAAVCLIQLPADPSEPELLKTNSPRNKTTA
jgi:hypothetical protein